MEQNIETIGICVVSLFAIAWLIRMAYAFCFYLVPVLRLRKKKAFTPSHDAPPVSVIVIALNKSPEFIRNIEKILTQKYPLFEVIIVIDNADKDVEDDLKLLMHFDSRVRYTFIPHEAKNISRRKLALTIAAKAAHYDWILQTEYTCYPASDTWLARMMDARNSDTGIVLGGTVSGALPIGMRRSMAYFDLLGSLEMLSCGIHRIPYVGNASNLLINKELLFDHMRCFGKSLKEEMGEDLVLVNAAATKENISVELQPESLTVSTLLDKKDWKKKEDSAHRCHGQIKGSGKKFWTANSFFSAVYGITFILAVITQWHSVLFLSIIGGMHLVYRCSFWGILYAYSRKSRSLRFYFLPFWSKAARLFV